MLARIALVTLIAALSNTAHAQEGTRFCLSDGQSLVASKVGKGLIGPRLKLEDGVRLLVPHRAARDCASDEVNPPKDLPRRMQIQDLSIGGQPLVGAPNPNGFGSGVVTLPDGNQLLATSAPLSLRAPIRTPDGDRAKGSPGQQRGQGAAIATGVVLGLAAGGGLLYLAVDAMGGSYYGA